MRYLDLHSVNKVLRTLTTVNIFLITNAGSLKLFPLVIVCETHQRWSSPGAHGESSRHTFGCLSRLWTGCGLLSERTVTAVIDGSTSPQFPHQLRCSTGFSSFSHAASFHQRPSMQHSQFYPIMRKPLFCIFPLNTGSSSATFEGISCLTN